jgi:hypothetical protein
MVQYTANTAAWTTEVSGSIPVSSERFYSSQRSDLLLSPTLPCVPGALL